MRRPRCGTLGISPMLTPTYVGSTPRPPGRCSLELRPHHSPEEDWRVVPTPSCLQSSSNQHRWHQPQCRGTLLSWVASSPMMLQSARILPTARPKPAVPLKVCQKECSRIIRSASSRRFRNAEPSSFPLSCTVQTPGFSTGSRSGY